ncbi:zinc knuckle, partial [Ostertagia ostertagi]
SQESSCAISIRGDEEVEDRARRIRRAIVAIEAELGTLENSLEKYAKAADSLDAETLNSSSEISQRIGTNIEAAQELLGQAQNALTNLTSLVAHLKRKYGDTQALVDRLLSKLQSAKANSDSLEDQETLCEQLLSITSQLDLHGEHIDNTFLQRELLGKFSIDVQRQILRQKPKWKVTAPTTRGSEKRVGWRKESFHSAETSENQLAPCFYCGKTGHPAKNCTEIPSLDQRLEIIKTQKLCRNCGQKDHTAAKCNQRGL